MRNTTTHTPGPWHIGVRTAHSKRDIYGEQGELVALADAVFTDLATAQVNARLIAAAPELLEALKIALAAMVTMHGENTDPGQMAIMRHAIAKAEGH
jgi:hypothetical protein